MKMIKRAGICLIIGSLLLGFLVVPVCADDDNSWLTADSLDNILAWMKMTAKPTSVIPSVSSGVLPETTPSYIPPDDSSWFTPDSPDQIIAWGKMIAKQTTTDYPSTLSQEDRIRLFKSYNTSGYVPVTPTVTVTPIPTTVPVPPTGTRFTTRKPVTVPATPYYMPSTTVTVIPSQKSITIPATPYYMPSTMPMAFPTQAPASGGTVSGTGISLTELNLQGKYVRITNSRITPVVMTGWKITNSRGNALNFIDFPLGGGTTFTYVLNPYSTLTVYFGKEGAVTSNELYYPYGVDFWDPHGDTASLYDPQGQLVGRISA